jgi:ribosomal protein S27AE
VLPFGRASGHSVDAFGRVMAFWSTLPNDPAALGLAPANPYADPLHMRTAGGANAPWTKYPPSLGYATHTTPRLSGGGGIAPPWAGGAYAASTLFQTPDRTRLPSFEYGPHAPAFQLHGHFPGFVRQSVAAESSLVPSFRISARPTTAPSRALNPKKVTSLRRRLERINREIQALRSDRAVPRSPSTRRYCTSCGMKLARSAKFCSQCGDPVLLPAGSDRFEASVEGEEVAPEEHQDEGPGHRRLHTASMVAAYAGNSTLRRAGRKQGVLEFDAAARLPDSNATRAHGGGGSSENQGETKAARKGHATNARASSPQAETPRRKLPIPRRTASGSSPMPSVRHEGAHDHGRYAPPAQRGGDPHEGAEGELNMMDTYDAVESSRDSVLHEHQSEEAEVVAQQVAII